MKERKKFTWIQIIKIITAIFITITLTVILIAYLAYCYTNKNVEIQTEKINETQNAFKQLEKDINTTVKDVENITGMIGALDEDNCAMLDIISNVSAVSQENSAATQETSANILVLTDKIEEIHEKTQVLHEHAEGLMREINAFKTEG